MAHKVIDVDIFIECRGLESVDMTAPESGNPGMGGSQYCFLMLAYFLKKFYSDSFNVRVISYEPLQLPVGIGNVVVNSLEEVLSVSSGSVLVMRQFNAIPPYDVIDRHPDSKIILWCHNFLFAEEAARVARATAIKGVVFVSRQMYDFYADHNITLKATPIFNMVPDTDAPPRRWPESPVITFMGQISKGKGIITLLKIWEQVRRSHPDAILNIIGKGNLYDRNTPVGPLGITDEPTEREMLPYITESDGSLSNSVRFLGILGKEKYEVFSNSTVGIVNPSSSTETFGMGIIEMASSSLPVVTRKWNGHPDTAIDGKTSLLALSVSAMAKCVNRLIEDKGLNLKLGKEARRQVARFAPDVIVPQWARLISDVASGNTSFPLLSPARPYWNNYKFMRYANRLLRHGLRLRFLPSVVDAETAAYQLLRKLKP